MCSATFKVVVILLLGFTPLVSCASSVFFTRGSVIESLACPKGTAPKSWNNCIEILYANGDRYLGEHQNGMAHGRGIYIDLRRGGSFEGNFFKGEKDGRGIYFHASGDQFEEEYKVGVGVSRIRSFDNKQTLLPSKLGPRVTDIPSAYGPPLTAAKEKCLDLGFKPATEKFGQCVLQLSK